MISRPQLPPREGYIEVEVDGKRVYKPIKKQTDNKTEEKISALESENKLLAAQVSALTDQNDFHEELIVELAGVVYA